MEQSVCGKSRPRILAILPPLLVAGCAATPPGADNFADRCFNAASIATEVTPVQEEFFGLCDHALASISLSRRDRAATLSNRGILRLGQGAYAAAKADFDAAVGIAPQLGETYVNRAAALLGLHRYAEALDDLNRAIDLNSTQLEKAFYNRALAREHLNDIKGAYYDYLKASQLRPDWGLPKQDLQRFKVTRRTQVA